MNKKEFSLALILLGWEQISKNKWQNIPNRIIFTNASTRIYFCTYLDKEILDNWVPFNSLETCLEYIQND